MTKEEKLVPDYLKGIKSTLDDFSLSFVEANKIWLAKKEQGIELDESIIEEIFGQMKIIKKNFFEQVSRLDNVSKIELYEYVMNLYNSSEGPQKRSLVDIRAFFINIL